MTPVLPFAGLDRRTACLRAALLGACFLGLIASAPMWLNARTFPLLRIAPWFPVLPAPWDKVHFGLMLVSLVAAAWRYREAVGFFLCASLFAFCEDQNRGQPWFYMYWVMLLLSTFPGPVSIAACQLSLSVVYLWSGIQKCNPGFHGVPDWFVSPAASHWHLPEAVVKGLRWAVATTPFTEIGIGVGLWLRPLRRIAMGAVLVVHLAAVLFLGPLGHNYNWVVWPWNLALIALVWALFAADEFWQPRKREAAKTGKGGRARSEGPGIRRAFADLRRSKAALAALGLYAFLPVLSYTGGWDSYFSFSLYSGNTANANLFISESFSTRLPPKVRAYVRPSLPNYDREHQGPLLINFYAWAYEEMHVPPIPEPRNYISIFRSLQRYSPDPGDLRLIVGTRTGKVIFYEADREERLQAPP